MHIRYRDYLDKYVVADILKTSILLALAVSAIVTGIALIGLYRRFAFGDLVIELLLVFGWAFSGVLVYSLTYQFLSPLFSKTNWAHRTNAYLVFAVSIVLSIGSMAGLYLYRDGLRETRIAAFNAHISDYLKERDAAPTDWSGSIGKVITVDRGNGQISDFYLKLPASFHPKTADEVDTLVWLKYGKSDIHKLTNGGEAYRITCDVTMIDLSDNVIIGRETFVGEDPTVPSHGAAQSDFPGPAPDDQIIAYIQSFSHGE